MLIKTLFNLSVTKIEMLSIFIKKMNKYVDVIILEEEKFSKEIQTLSNLPIIGHLEGICHTFVDKDANLKISKKLF